MEPVWGRYGLVYSADVPLSIKQTNDGENEERC